MSPSLHVTYTFKTGLLFADSGLIVHCFVASEEVSGAIGGWE